MNLRYAETNARAGTPSSGMKAVVCTRDRALAVVNAPMPMPTPGQSLIRMLTAGICGSDVTRMFFGDPDGAPVIGRPGHEGVGEIVECASGLFAVGDQVLVVPRAGTTGTFVEYLAIEDSQLVPIDRNLDAAQSVLAQQLGTVIYALKRFALPEQPVRALVIGAGPAGWWFSEMLARRGDRVTVIDLEPSRVMRMSSHGIHAVKVDASPEVAARMLGPSGPFDLVVEAAGSDEARRLAILVAERRGTVGFFGTPRSGEDIRLPFHRLFRNELTTHSVYEAQAEPALSSMREALDLIGARQVRTDGLVTHRVSLDRIWPAILRARDRSDDCVKQIVDMRLPMGSELRHE